MKKTELAVMLETAKTYFESSNIWFGYKMEAEENGNLEYAKTCASISLEGEYKARGICEVIEMLTGHEFTSWNFIYTDEWENTKRICGLA